MERTHYPIPVARWAAPEKPTYLPTCSRSGGLSLLFRLKPLLLKFVIAAGHHRGPTTLGVSILLAAALLSGCAAGPSAESPIDLGGTPTPEVAGARQPFQTPRAIVVVTPVAYPTPEPGATSEALATRQPTLVATPSATSTPAATPTIAPSRQLPELTRALDEKVGTLAQALAARDVDRSLRLQGDLLAEADRVEKALETDRSAQADLVRQALKDIRAGTGGSRERLDSARAKLRVASGQSSSASDTSTPEQSIQNTVSSLQSKLKDFTDARNQQQVEQALKLQQGMLAEISQAEKALANQHSDSADRLRSALRDLKAGLSGEESKLESAATALDAVAGTSAQSDSQSPATSRQLQAAAASLDQKLAAFREALSGGGRDRLLSAQRDLLAELDRAEAASQGNNSDEANRIRDAVALARQGASGDAAKLDEANSRLNRAGGASGTAPSTSSQSAQSVQASDLPSMADDLSRQVDSFKAAIQKGDRADMLRLQQQLTEQLNESEQAIRGKPGREADQFRSALSDLRNALAGDLNKLNSANASLRLVASGPETPSQPSPRQTQQDQQESQQAQSLARELSRTMDDVEAALQSGNPDDLARVRKELQQAEDEIQKLSPDQAAALKSAASAANESLAGDRAKLDVARSQLKQIIPR